VRFWSLLLPIHHSNHKKESLIHITHAIPINGYIDFH